MSDVKFMMLATVIMRICYCVCVTVAAIHFENAVILWWYILALCMGWQYKSNGEVNTWND